MRRKSLLSEMEREVCAAADAREHGTALIARDDAGASAGHVAAVLVMFAIAGCASSAPLRFYTLSAVAPAAADAAGAVAIRVGRVRIPAELDRMELVQRVDANRLSIGELDRWAAPMEDMVRRVLTADLQARASAGGHGQAPATLNVDIEEFIGDASCNVTLSASWELKGAAAPPGAGEPKAEPASRSGRESIRVPGNGGACPASSLPVPMSQALGQLAERISLGRPPIEGSSLSGTQR